jgi:glycerol uptake facilitator-like aquaporin
MKNISSPDSVLYIKERVVQNMLKIMQENLEDLTSPNLWRAVAAEMLGTIFLVFLGCGSHTLQLGQMAVANGTQITTAEPSVVQIALTFGLAVGTMVWCIAHIRHAP